MTATPREPASLLISGEQLKGRIKELGAEIAADYEDGDGLLMVGLLKGSTYFLADLFRSTELDVVVDFMAISSYSGDEHSGVVRIVKDLEEDVSGRDVLIVEDIVDTGLTLNYLRRNLSARGPRSLKTVTLLDRAARRIIPVELEYSGFEIPDVFVIGYGLDFQGLYRNVGEIFAVRDLPRLVNDPGLLRPSLFGKRSRRG